MSFSALPSQKQNRIQQVLHIIITVGVVLASLVPQAPAYAAANLTVTPITWNVVGLDSNRVDVGPNNFPIGARVCNPVSNTVTLSDVEADFVWLPGGTQTTDAYIRLRAGSLDPIQLSPQVDLAPGRCQDFYFEVQIERDPISYDETRRYRIDIQYYDPDAGMTKTVTSPTPREIYVEHLVSQSRNYTTDVQLNGGSIPSGGTMALMVGQTYEIKLLGSTATNGYEQIETFINFPNTIFQVLSVQTTYTADTSGNVSSPDDKLYGNGCTWENDPNSPNYRSCLGVGKAGGNITVTYQVKIVGGAGTSQPLSTLIYDFSGSSYHYNADFGVSTRIAYIVSPSAVTIAKNFSPDPTNAGGGSTLTFTLTNPTPVTVTGLNFTDVLPTSPGAMRVASPPNASTTGCGTPTFSPAANDASLSFSNGTLAPNSTCTIKVNVTVPVSGTYNNTSAHLFVGTLDTGNFATDSLTVNSSPPTPTPVCGVTLAQWTFDGFASNPPPQPGPSSKAPNVATAQLSVGGTVPGTLVDVPDASTGSPAFPALLTYGWPNNQLFDPNTHAYLQFEIDTSQYAEVKLQFNAYRKNPGPSTNTIYYRTDTSGWTLLPGSSFTAASGWGGFGPYDFTGRTSTTGSTYFRIFGSGANSSTSGGDLSFDNFTFTGCGTPQPPALAKAFSPNPVAVGIPSTLTFTVTNPNSGFALNSISFTDTLPSGLTVTSGSSSVCGGTLTRTAPQSISLSGGTLAAGASCTIPVTIGTTAAGVYNNVSGFVAGVTSGGETLTNTGPTGVATASLTVLKPPSISKLFAPNPIIAGGTSTLTFTITNPNQNDALTGVAFADTYPLGVVNVNPLPVPGNTCGGSATAAADGNIISLSSGSVPAGGSCTVTVNVKAAGAGIYPNTSGTVSSTNGGTGNTASNTLTVNAPNPAISLLKQVSTTATGPWSKFVGVNVGDPIYYQFTIENIGDVDLSSVNITDPALTALGVSLAGCSRATLVKYDSATCVVGPVSAASGSNTNMASAHGTYGGTTYDSTSSAATYASTGLSIVKNVTEGYFVNAGDVLHYTYTVTNTGYAPLLGPVTISDNKSTDEACPGVETVGDLDAYFDRNEVITCTSTYTVTAADVTARVVTNDAFATVSGVTSPTVSKTVTLYVPELAVTKTNNTSNAGNVGTAFAWTLTVSNTGVVDATFANGQTILRDPLPAAATYASPTPGNFSGIINSGNILCSIDGSKVLTCTASGNSVTLAASSGSFTVAFDVTPTAAGDLANTATVDPNGNVTEVYESNNTGSNTVSVIAPPSIAKSFSPDAIAAGQTSTLTFTITNPNASTMLTGVAFGDTYPAAIKNGSTLSTTNTCGGTLTAAADGGDISISGVSLAGGASCEVSIVVTSSTPGAHANTSGNVTSTNGGTGNTASDTLTVATPSILVVKQVSVDGGTTWQDANSAPGPYLVSGTNPQFRYMVRNTSAVTLTNISLSDNVSALNTSIASTCTVPANLTADDGTAGSGTDEFACTITGTWAAGQHTNTATAQGRFNGVDYSDTDSANYFGASPSLVVVKEVSVDGGSSWQDANTVTGPSVPSGTDPQFRFTVTNTGNIQLDVALTDSDFSLPLSCDPGTLAANDGSAGGADEFTCTYAGTWASGQHTNTATVSSSYTDTAGSTVNPSDTDDANYFGTTSSIAQDKTVSSGPTATGTPDQYAITYQIAVTNSGGASGTYDLNDAPSFGVGITVNSASFTFNGGAATPLAGSGPWTLATGATLAASGTDTYLVTVTLTVNPATARGTAKDCTLDGGETGTGLLNTSDLTTGGSTTTDTACQPTPDIPLLTLAKSITSGDPYSTAGATISYSYLVTNTGNASLAGPVTVADNKATVTCPNVNTVGDNDANLDPGESLTCTASYSVTQLDLDHGSVTNTATASAGGTDSNTDSQTADAIQSPDITVMKEVSVNGGVSWVDANSAPGPSLLSGTNPQFRFTVTNAGNVTLTALSLSDSDFSTASCTIPASLAPAGSFNCSVTGTWATGQHTNTATVQGSFNSMTYSDSDDANYFGASPSLSVLKEVSVDGGGSWQDANSATGPSLASGTDPQFRFTVTNTGNVTLTGISLSDSDFSTAGCTIPASLAPSGSFTCTITGTWAAGQHTDTASVSSTYTDTTGASITSSDTDDANYFGAAAALNVVKEVSADGTTWNDTTITLNAGATVYFRVRVENTGNVTLSGLSVDDGMAGCALTRGADIIGDDDANFEPGEEWSYTCSLSAAAGTNNNTATANSNETPQDSDAASYFGNDPSLNIVKEVSTDNSTWNDTSLTVDVGDTVYYRVRVENTGNVTLTGLVVDDGMTGCSIARGSDLSGDGDADFEAGEEWAYTCSVTALAGDNLNTATADSNETGQDTDDATYFGQADPDAITKTVTSSNQAFTSGTDVAIGEIVTFEVEFNVPAGTFNTVTLEDNMGPGLAFVECDSVTPSNAANVSTSVPGGFDAVCTGPTVDSGGSLDAEDIDRHVTYFFGTLTNTGTATETITITYTAVVLDIQTNQDGVSVSNNASLTWSGGSLGPSAATLSIVEPDLSIDKTVDNNFISNGTEVTFTLTIQHTADSHAHAYDVVVLDPLPASLDVAAGSLDCTVGNQDADVECAYDAATRTIRAVWSEFNLTGGNGQITFRVSGNANLPPNGTVSNIASVAWTSLPDPFGNLPQSHNPDQNQFSTERWYDPGDPVDVYGANDSLTLNPLGGEGDDADRVIDPFVISSTGFAPNQRTDLRLLSRTSYMALNGLTLQIPAQNLNISVTGVRLENGKWNVNWLQSRAGWLEKTAYPTFPGNSVITAHVVSADGKAGPFFRLRNLGIGEQVIIQLGGYRYIYIVRSTGRVQPGDISVLEHKETPWLTLITCDDYDVKTGDYLYRFIVRAQLVQVDRVQP